jgi:hypothetical protein
MGFLDAKAAAAKAQAHRKPVDSVSMGPARTLPAIRQIAPTGVPAGKADRAVVGFEVLEAVARWPEDLRNEWAERASIIEYDGGEPRLVAEQQAYEIVRTAHEAALLIAEAKQ